MNGCGLSLRVMGCLGLLGCAATAQAWDRSAVPHTVAGFGVPVSAERLAAVRGGFDLGDGLQVSFGIQRAVYVDGNLVTYMNVSIPDIAHITTQQAISLATALSTVNVQIGSGNTFDPSSTTTQAGTTRAIPAQPPAPASASASIPSAPSGAVGQVASATSPATQSNAATDVQNASTSPVITSTISPASVTQPSAATVIQNTVNNQVIRSLTTLNVAVNALNAMRNQGLQQSLQAAQQLQALSH